MATDTTYRRRRATPPWVLLGALLLPALADDLAAQEPACRRAALSPSLDWVSAAVGFVGDVNGGAGVLVVDPVQNLLALYDDRGDGVDLGSFGLEPFLPSSVRRTPSGTYLLKLAGTKLLALSEDLKAVESVGPLRDQAGGTGITSLYDWTVTEDRILAFGTVMAPDREAGYRIGFLTAPLSALDKPELVIEADEGQFYLYNQPYFATIGGDRGYFVRFSGREAKLYEVTFQGAFRELEGAIPRRYRRAPVVKTPNKGPESSPAIYAEIEKKSIVAGLFNIQERLFLLTRNPTPRGRTLWRMFQVDLETGRPAADSFVLPTTAPHITLAVAGATVFIYEKGKVVGLGSHPVQTIKTFSTGLLTEPEGSALVLKRMASAPVHCVGP